MKKLFSIVIVFLLAIFVACKKEDKKLPTNMRVDVDGDTVFVTTNVISSKSGNDLAIRGTSEDGKKRIELSLANYNGKNGTYTIDHRGIGGSTAQYLDDGNHTVASGGRIVVNSVSDGVIKGTFYFYYFQKDISGSFTAPQ